MKITTTNICGSDLHMYEGRTDGEGKVLGHENLGEVIEIGGGRRRQAGTACACRSTSAVASARTASGAGPGHPRARGLNREDRCPGSAFTAPIWTRGRRAATCRPARSALTLRLGLAAFGLLAGLAGLVIVLLTDVPRGFAVLFGLIALTALVDLIVVAGRKRRGEPG